MIKIAGSTRLTTCAAKTVFDEGSDAIRRSVSQRLRAAHAASVPSDSPKPPKARKISMDERRALVESYVNKYRESHAGRFPTIAVTLEDVGGGFYHVRKIIQELKYKSKVVPAVSEIETQGPEKAAKESESFTGVENTPSEALRVDTDVGDASEIFVDVEPELQTSEEVLLEEVIESKVQEKSDIARTQPNQMERNIDTKGLHPCFPEKSDEVKRTQTENINLASVNENLLKEEEDDQHSKRPEILKNVSHSKEADDQHSKKPEILKIISQSEEADDQHSKRRPEILKNISQSEKADDQHSKRLEILKNISQSEKADDQHSKRPEILKNISQSEQLDDQHSKRPEISKNISHSQAEISLEDKNEHFVSGDISGPDNPKYKEELSKQDKYVQHISDRQTNEAEHRKESAIWRNLKSFADGIVNIWRKM